MKVAIIGLGLIGGSIGLALREAGFGDVAGYDQRPEVVSRALERGAIDHGASSVAAAARDAGLVVLATPPLAVREAMIELAPELAAHSIVTDTASTKQQVLAWARELLPPRASFVGGHPMAGSEQHGIDNARADLFRDATYCLVVDDATSTHDLVAVEGMVASLGAAPLRIDAAVHDAAVAAVSHLPFVVAAALVASALAEQPPGSTALPSRPERRRLAATGFRDTTRTASGDPLMHRDICLANANALRPLLLDMARRLDEVAAHLDEPEFLLSFFTGAQRTRDEWRRGDGETGSGRDRGT